MSGAMVYLSVCAIYRDEGPYLREWIEFHRLFGVERFYLYNNLSEDDHRETLAPYVEEGTVVPYEWPMFPGQLQAYDHCLKKHCEDSRWIAFIDLDEFLFSPTGQAVSEILTEYEEFPGVGVNSLAYGTSGHQTKPPGLVIESYVRRGVIEGRNRIIKSIVDPTRVERPGNEPHYFRYYDFARAVTENKEPIKGSLTEKLSCERLRINHYITRSQDERNKKLAGPVPYTGEPRKAERAAERDKELNELLDDVILRFAPAVWQALAARGSVPAG